MAAGGLSLAVANGLLLQPVAVHRLFVAVASLVEHKL